MADKDYTYTKTPVISKLVIGDTLRYLKDAEVRSALDSLLNNLKSAAYLDADAAVSADATGVAKTSAVKSYVDSAVADIKIGDIVIDEAKGGEGADKNQPKTTASADTYKKIYLVPDAESIEQGSYIEWLTIRTNTGTEEEPVYTYAWESIGTTKIDLADYLTKAATVAGVSFGDDKAITGEELVTALALKSFAFVDKGEGTVDDYVTGVTSAKVTATGTVALTEATETDADKLQVAGTNTESTVTITAAGTNYVKTSINARMANDTDKQVEGVDDETLVFYTATGDEVGDPTADLSGTAAAQTFTGGYVKATFTGTEADADVTLTKGNKTIEVSPKAAAAQEPEEPQD